MTNRIKIVVSNGQKPQPVPAPFIPLEEARSPVLAAFRKWCAEYSCPSPVPPHIDVAIFFCQLARSASPLLNFETEATKYAVVLRWIMETGLGRELPPGEGRAA
jgi:hypothetical protein